LYGIDVVLSGKILLLFTEEAEFFPKINKMPPTNALMLPIILVLLSPIALFLEIIEIKFSTNTALLSTAGLQLGRIAVLFYKIS